MAFPLKTKSQVQNQDLARELYSTSLVSGNRNTSRAWAVCLRLLVGVGHSDSGYRASPPLRLHHLRPGLLAVQRPDETQIKPRPVGGDGTGGSQRPPTPHPSPLHRQTRTLEEGSRRGEDFFFLLFITLGLELSDTKVYEP